MKGGQLSDNQFIVNSFQKVEVLVHEKALNFLGTE